MTCVCHICANICKLKAEIAHRPQDGPQGLERHKFSEPHMKDRVIQSKGPYLHVRMH